MKHLKKFENSRFIENIPVSEYESPQQIAIPIKRRITEEESLFMARNMSNYAFSTVIDANGHIGLGGGMGREDVEPTFMRYITENDLINAMVKDRYERAKRSF